jgi:nucleotide-binding universal stress UspA family protein
MPDFRHILFPVDFSERCKEFRHLVELVARQFRARLTLLHVVPILSGGDYGDLAGVFPSIEDYTAVEARMSGLLNDFFPGECEGIPEINRQVLLGDPAVAIVDSAANYKVDLVMMPTHGYGRFRNLLMGSVASKVLHDVACPVWTAAHGEGPGTVGGKGVKSILAAADLADGQIDVIGNAANLGRKFDATVTLVHAVPAAEHVAGDTGGDELGRFLVRAAREQIERLQTQAGTTFEVRVEPASVAKAIRKAALETNADLVVLGRGVTHAPFGRLRSKSYEIIRESPCPVLSL